MLCWCLEQKMHYKKPIKSSACAAHLLAGDINMILYTSVNLQCKLMCVCVERFSCAFDIHNSYSDRSNDMLAISLSSGLKSMIIVMVLVAIEQLSVHRLKQTQWNLCSFVRSYTYTSTFNCHLNSFAFIVYVWLCTVERVVRMFVCVCDRALVPWLGAKTRFVCFGYCQLLFWFLSWCFWTTLSLSFRARDFFLQQFSVLLVPML